MRDAAAAARQLGEILDRGGFLAVPTESSYALAADPRNVAGVAAVFAFKRRPPNKPLPVVAADREAAEALGARLDGPVLDRLAGLWPAPLTLVAPLARDLPAALGASTVAVRVPAHEDLLALLRVLDRPLTATSANRSGEEPIVDPDRLAEDLAGSPAALVDGGVLAGGPPSTLVAVEGDALRVLRRGAFPVERLAAEISAATVEISEEAGPRAAAPPGV